MFKKTLTLTELKRDINDLLGELCGNDALQVVHRGKQIKVVITQEHYFQLLGQLAQLSGTPSASALIEDTSTTKRKQRLKRKLGKTSDERKKKNRPLVQDGI